MEVMEKGSAGLSSIIAISSTALVASLALSTLLPLLVSEASISTTGDEGKLTDSLQDVFDSSTPVSLNTNAWTMATGSDSTLPDLIHDKL